MKKQMLKKWILPIGAVALATTPFVSVISCSNNDGGKPSNPGGGGNPTPNPTPTKEIINYFASFDYHGDSMIYYGDTNLLVNFDDWKNKILNDQIKWFNEDGSHITYELNIHLDAGLAFGDRYADVKIAANKDNQYKTIKKPIDIKWKFYKKEDNKSFKYDDFISNVITVVPYKKDGDFGTLDVAFPLDSTIVYAKAKGKDLNSSKILQIIYAGIETKRDGRIYASNIYDITPQNWESIKNLFNPTDSFDTNLVVEGLENSNRNEVSPSSIRSGYVNNVKGSITIKTKFN